MEDNSYNKNKPIGIFDSGVGGISVLKKAIKILPNEDYIYFGDSKNAPYGVKTVEEIKKLTFKAIDLLLSKGCKAIVVACNTATSAAIEDLRKKFKDLPIIGIEPAVRPAVNLNRKGKILIMATPITLAENKFNNLVERCAVSSEVVALPCAGLVEMIEEGVVEGSDIKNYLVRKFEGKIDKDISCIVLGCTHYPFIKKEIVSVIGDEIPIIDGSEGTARELKRRLEQSDLLSNSDEKGDIQIFNSKDNSNLIDLSYKLLELK
ncbi:glutamate racemase [Clostridium algidicarnis]|uniref:Glutamate racemase n=1 Tax=Clostridium algidicarnis TaxID=37659 RepID=A0ABS6C0P0_9CLOT|nr:glutamate racemase [Clostridium algidicarnis]MBU3219036.1 glutamate racemase [Clostridium algidicarnis]